MTVDRAPKPCLHKIARHEHGTRLAYTLDRCRCLPCCHAIHVYEQARVRRNAYGRSNLVDAQPVRAHVAALMAAGIGLKRIVKTSGVSQGVLWKLVYGKNGGTPSRRVRRPTADRLLALDPADPTLLADGAKVPGVGAARRLQALTYLGWSINRLSGESGIDRQVLDQAIRGGQIVARHARAVAVLYERLWDQPAPAADHRERISVARALNRAQMHGWAPPAAWDDDTIDDPAAIPALGDADEDLVDELAIDAVLDGESLPLTGRDLEAAALRLAEAGHSYVAIAARCRCDEHTIRRVLNTARQRNARSAEREGAA